MTASCPRCSRPLSAEARFCPGCGTATREGRALIRAEVRGARRGEARAAWVLAVAFGGGLLAVFAPWIVAGADATEFGWPSLLIQASVDLVAILAGFLLLTRGGRAAFFGAGPWTTQTFGLAFAVGSAGFLFSLAYVWALHTLLLSGDHAVELESTLPMVVLAVLLAPVLEELLCRGVAYQAARQFGGPRLAVVMSAVLFAILHGANGGFVLEFPHRFVAGLGLGWLRWRTDALSPCILAHFIWNAAAVAVSS